MIIGRTYEQRHTAAKASYDKSQAREKARADAQQMLADIGWHDWFAWRPVILDDGRKAWLETVRRIRDRSEWDRHWLWRYEDRAALSSQQKAVRK